MAVGRPRRNDYVKFTTSVSLNDKKLLNAEKKRLKLSYSALIERIIESYFSSDSMKRAADITWKLKKVLEILDYDGKDDDGKNQE